MTKITDNMRKYSSQVVDGVEAAPGRAMLRAVGFTDEDFKKLSEMPLEFDSCDVETLKKAA